VAINYQKLDNPVWFSLTETHKKFSIGSNGIKFYQPDYCPFGGFSETNDVVAAIEEYAAVCDNFYIVGKKPDYSGSLDLKNELVCNQMIVEDKINLVLNEKIIKLTNDHSDQLFQLVNLVQPGYFKNNTRMLGNYYGIFKEDQLVAVTGERMAMNGLIEVSAVVTHPGHTGHGYAKQLVAHTVNEIINQKQAPFLHVAETNLPAIRLYENLGFTTRRKISFWHFVK
jgi:GNAT superfamily N-acetyltransferase